MTRRLLATMSIALFLLSTSLLALADGDTSPPSLVSMTFYPTAVNTTMSAQLVTVTVRLTDDLSGVTDGEINGWGVAPTQLWFFSPSGNQKVAALFTPPTHLVSGDALDGVYASTVSLPRFCESGVWTVHHIQLVDDVNNISTLWQSDLSARGFPTQLVVESASDTTPPTLATFDFEPKVVDTDISSQLITVTARLTDNLSGVSNGNQVSISQAWFFSPSENQRVPAIFVPSQNLVSGNALDGVYISTAVLPRFSEGGIWKLHHFQLVDDVGNSGFLWTDDLTARGFPTQLEVTGQGDLTPPNLASLNFSPDTVDLAGPARLMTFTARLTDDLSGITDGERGGYGVAPTELWLFSPSGNQKIPAIFLPQQHLLSGDALDGVYASTISFPPLSEGGMWQLDHFMLVDDVGNTKTLSQADLASFGIPTTVLVGVLVSPEQGGSLIYNDFQNGEPALELTSTIEIPAGAVTETILFTYTPVPTTTNLPVDMSAAGKTFNLNAYRNRLLLSNFNFSTPATITLNYANSSILGMDEEMLILAYWDGNTWVDITESCPLSEYDRQPDLNQITVSTCHLSKFALLGPKPPGIYLPIILRK